MEDIMKNLFKKNKDLFSEFKDLRLDEKEQVSRSITIDGPITELYFETQPRILWILREPHNEGGESLIEYVNNDLIGRDKPQWPKWYSTWGLIIKVSDAILNNNYNMYDKHPRNIKKCLENIAVINLNKFGGGKRKSRHYRLGAQKCKKLVQRQYEILSPDIVIFGGTGQDFIHLEIEKLDIKNIFSNKNNFPTFKKGNVIYFSAYHPGQRKISHLTYCDYICRKLIPFQITK